MDDEKSGMTIKCNNCGFLLDESYNQSVNRTPCPACGSTSRNYEVIAHVSMGMKATIGVKAKHPGGKRPFYEEKTRGEIQIKSGKNVDRTNVIDRDNDGYTEIIKDAKTGEVLYECSEPLSKHIGHGCAKNKKKA